jgi:hypothetical protein
MDPKSAQISRDDVTASRGIHSRQERRISNDVEERYPWASAQLDALV